MKTKIYPKINLGDYVFEFNSKTQELVSITCKNCVEMETEHYIEAYESTFRPWFENVRRKDLQIKELDNLGVPKYERMSDKVKKLYKIK